MLPRSGGTLPQTKNACYPERAGWLLQSPMKCSLFLGPPLNYIKLEMRGWVACGVAGGAAPKSSAIKAQGGENGPYPV